MITPSEYTRSRAHPPGAIWTSPPMMGRQCNWKSNAEMPQKSPCVLLLNFLCASSSATFSWFPPAVLLDSRQVELIQGRPCLREDPSLCRKDGDMYYAETTYGLGVLVENYLSAAR